MAVLTTQAALGDVLINIAVNSNGSVVNLAMGIIPQVDQDGSVLPIQTASGLAQGVNALQKNALFVAVKDANDIMEKVRIAIAMYSKDEGARDTAILLAAPDNVDMDNNIRKLNDPKVYIGKIIHFKRLDAAGMRTLHVKNKTSMKHVRGVQDIL